jgi:hypothetical protein
MPHVSQILRDMGILDGRNSHVSQLLRDVGHPTF